MSSIESDYAWYNAMNCYTISLWISRFSLNIYNLYSANAPTFMGRQVYNEHNETYNSLD